MLKRISACIVSLLALCIPFSAVLSYYDIPAPDSVGNEDTAASGSSSAVDDGGFSYETLEVDARVSDGVVLELPVYETPYGSDEYRGEGENHHTNRIAYAYYEGGDGDIEGGIEYLAPDAFLVTEKGEVAILDTYNKLIRVYSLDSRAETRTIDIGKLSYPRLMTSLDGVFYVLDSARSRIAVVKDEITAVYELPKISETVFDPSYSTNFYTYEYNMGPVVSSLRVDDGELVVCAGSDGEYRLKGGKFVKSADMYDIEDDGKTFTVRFNGNEWSFSSGGIGIDVCGVDAEGNLYVYCCSTLIDEDGRLTGDSTLRVYDSKSRLVKCAVVDYSSAYLLPYQHIALGPDNCFYQMVCDEDAVRIVRMWLSDRATIVNNHVSPEGTHKDNNPVTRESQPCANVPFTTARTNAIAYTTHDFTVYSLNKHDWDGSGSAF